MVLRAKPAKPAFRIVPVIIGSVLLHAGAAMALAATGSGHARTTVTLPNATIDVETIAAEPLLEPVPVEEEAPAPNVAAAPKSFPTHTHDYPVPPDHDAHPHDPSLKHDSLGHADDHDHDAPAAAAPVVAADPFAALPHFDLPSGGGSPSAHGAVAANAAGSGEGTGAGGHDHDDDAVYAASGVQVPARLVGSVVAQYPLGARADDVEGDVVVEVVLERDGRVIDARVSKPAGHGFDDAALAAIRRYRFSPAQRGGHAVRVRMPWTVQFRLR